jgi:hypothetical protein
VVGERCICLSLWVPIDSRWAMPTCSCRNQRAENNITEIHAVGFTDRAGVRSKRATDRGLSPTGRRSYAQLVFCRSARRVSHPSTGRPRVKRSDNYPSEAYPPTVPQLVNGTWRCDSHRHAEGHFGVFFSQQSARMETEYHFRLRRLSPVFLPLRFSFLVCA